MVWSGQNQMSDPKFIGHSRMRSKTSVLLPMLLAALLAGVSYAADRGPGMASNCIVITGSDWQSKLGNEFGNEICLVGRVSVGPDGVDFVVSPPFGPPPYGKLIRTSWVELEMVQSGVKTGETVALRGKLLGRSLCGEEAKIEGCDRPWARLNRYYLYVRDKSFIQKISQILGNKQWG